MVSLTVKSPAKLNLYLNVLEERGDGYHEIETVFERIDLVDEIKLTETQGSKIELFCNSAEVPLDGDSLVYSSIELLKKEANSPKGIRVTIDKRIPIASGLGGGSSNAASIILGLNKFWGLNLTIEKLLNIGRILGADLSFFLYDKPLGVGFERGDKIESLPSLEKVFWHILVVPQEKISSGEAYSLSRSYSKTIPVGSIKTITQALRKGDLALLKGNLYNSLEEAVETNYPVIRKVKQAMAALGLRSTLMSGSGPAVFGLTDTKKEAMRLKRELDSRHTDWRTFVVSTY